VRWFHELSADSGTSVAGWRNVVDRALAEGHWGPVHLDVALREPLVPDGDATWSEPLDVEIDRLDKGGRQLWDYADLVAAADRGGRGDQAQADARGLAAAGGWPLLAEPSSGHRAGPNALAAYRLLLGHLGDGVQRVMWPAGHPVPAGDSAAGPHRPRGAPAPRRPAHPDVIGSPDPEWLRLWQERRPRRQRCGGLGARAEPVTGLSVARLLAHRCSRRVCLSPAPRAASGTWTWPSPWVDPPLVLAEPWRLRHRRHGVDGGGSRSRARRRTGVRADG